MYMCVCVRCVYFFPLKNIRIRRSKRKGCPANGSRLKEANKKKRNERKREGKGDGTE